MDGFTYHNIFETKGIEYIVIIAFLILLIPFWVVLNRRPRIAARIRETLGVLTAGILRIPQGLFFSKNHTWAFLERSGNAKIGVDDFLLQVVGNVSVSQMKSPGEKLKKGDILAEIDQNGKRLSILSPISGEVVSANTSLQEAPGMLNNDPYEEGWLYAVKPSDWKGETAACFVADAASKWFKAEVTRFKDFLATSLSKHSPEPSLVALQEGGEIRRNVLSELDKDIWDDFENAFLK